MTRAFLLGILAAVGAMLWLRQVLDTREVARRW